MSWYQQDINSTVNKLKTDVENGLTASEAQSRLTQYGLNELIEKGTRSPWLILFDQLRDVMVVILIIAAIVSGVLGDFKDVIVILAIIILNAAIGFSQEHRAEQAIAALKKLAVPTVKVRRDGRLVEVSARELVPGDVVLLEAGNLVPADGRLLESINLRVEEAALTGESEAVEKMTDPIDKESLPMGDRTNMVFMGTVITYGRGTAVITGTGMQTELGNIAELIQGVEQEQTPLQRRLDDLGKKLAWVAFIIVGMVVISGYIFRDPNQALIETLEVLFLTGISLAVAAVPEGLPAVVTITLALGSQRMLKRNSLIRKLPAVETLGSITIICSDKTGTLTENKMTVTVLDVTDQTETIETVRDAKGAIMDAELKPNLEAHRRTQSLLLKAGALCNDAVLQVDGGVERAIGDPTEGALVVAAATLGYRKDVLDKQWPRIDEIPFTSERKRMTTIHQINKDMKGSDAPWGGSPFVAFSKGAVDSLLQISDRIWTGKGKEFQFLDETWRKRILDGNAKMAGEGQRVLALAFRPLQNVDDERENNAILIGLVGMIDPPRPEVKAAVAIAKKADIRAIMITGDHPLTAQNIAKDLGITQDDHNLTGYQLAKMSLAELEEQVEDVAVYARVSPEHKLNIVEALQDKGHIVAMTGDGVNDAPALKKADIGIAMGITGTDVSKEAADMILLDDNFATIVAAVEEGRKIFDNIRKFVKYTLSSNTGELFVMLLGPFLGMPLPLIPLQILWINLVTDGLPGLALAVEDGERGIMKRSPFHPKESIFSRGMGKQIIWIGILMGIVSLGIGYIYWLKDPNGPWQTMVFTTLTLAQMGNAMATRSNTDSIFKLGLFSNKLMVLAISITFLLQLALIYVPFLQGFFRTEALPLSDLLIALAASLIVFVAVEISKIVKQAKT
ncbi:Cation-transporting ATPase, E1-E2 family [hydrothermal vent metagenome]|uniref:Cation-transporting ATPase, E1-E2 family n=1 Tax=hydrothermal vent metagenome TaxID=652676 RepID=A0A3B0VH31_9ZZZZ